MPSPSSPASAGRTPEGDYFASRQGGNYAEAMDSLERWTAGLEDPAAIAANLYRIEELLALPELRGRGMRALAAIRSKAADPFARDHADRLLAACYRADGDTLRAEKLVRDLSYLDFQASGPFKGGSGEGFDRACPAETGAVPESGWFPVAPDRTGSIDLIDLFPGTKGSHFFLRRAIEIDRSGEYYLVLGTTGSIDLWLDGVKIFSERAAHRFSHDQYFIRVSLPRAAHALVLRVGGSDEGIRCSLRVAAVDGARLPPAVPDVSGAGAPGSFIGAGYFPSLAGLIEKSGRNPDAAYLAGYLLHAAGLYGDGSGRAGAYLSSLPEGHPRRSSAFYYLAMEADDPAAKDRLLAQSLQADQKNMESLRELALVKIGRDFIYEAAPLIETVGASASARHWHDELTARLFLHAGPAAEAWRHITALESSPYPSTGYRLGASYFLSGGDYFHAAQELEHLVRLDHSDRESSLLLLDCLEMSGDLKGAEGLLARLLYRYPNGTGLKLRLARVIEARRGPGPALPCLSAALKAAPGDRGVLRALGTVYHRMGNRGLALYYLGRALEADPGDRALGRYLEYIRNGAARPLPPGRPQ